MDRIRRLVLVVVCVAVLVAVGCAVFGRGRGVATCKATGERCISDLECCSYQCQPAPDGGARGICQES